MKRCLIVDDYSVVRKVAKRILTSTNLLIAEAGSGYEALGLCRAEMPDLIIVDATLPDMSAVDFIQQAFGCSVEVKPQIVICITEVDVGMIMRAKRAGASGYIMKPFNRPQLLERFRQLQIAA